MRKDASKHGEDDETIADRKGNIFTSRQPAAATHSVTHPDARATGVDGPQPLPHLLDLDLVVVVVGSRPDLGGHAQEGVCLVRDLEIRDLQGAEVQGVLHGDGETDVIIRSEIHLDRVVIRVTVLALSLDVARHRVPPLDDPQPHVRDLVAVVLAVGGPPLGETALVGDAPSRHHHHGVRRPRTEVGAEHDPPLPPTVVVIREVLDLARHGDVSGSVGIQVVEPVVVALRMELHQHRCVATKGHDEIEARGACQIISGGNA